MSKIFLGGGGDLQQSFKLDKEYFSELGEFSKILYLPIAKNQTLIQLEQGYDWFASLVNLHAPSKDIDFTMVSDLTDIKNIYDYTSIYIGGGNCFRLIKLILESKFEHVLLDFLMQVV